MLKTIHLSLTVPEEIDAEEIVETMYMELRIIDRGVYTVVDKEKE